MDGRQFTNRVWENEHWLICKALDTGRMFVIKQNTGQTDYPVLYDDGRIAYESPERIPKYVQEIVRGFYVAGFHVGTWERAPRQYQAPY